MATFEKQGQYTAFRTKRETSDSRFESLYRDSYELVYNWVSYRMAGSEAVEDVTAEAFLKAARSFDRFDESRAKFSTWVIAIARNCVIDYWKKKRPTESIDDIPDGAFAQEDEYPGLNEDEALVRRLLAQIEERDRELVFMKYYEGKKNIEIARELNMNESTIATRLQRALKKMRSAAEGDA